MSRYFLQNSKAAVLSMASLRADNVIMLGNSFLKRLYLTFIADSFQLMTRAVRNIGVSESDELRSSADSFDLSSHRARTVTPSPGRIDCSISLMRHKTLCFF